MYPIIKADGTKFQPEQPHGRGGRIRYPMRFLEVGDSFKAIAGDLPTLRAMIYVARHYGREHTITPDNHLGITAIITRTR